VSSPAEGQAPRSSDAGNGAPPSPGGRRDVSREAAGGLALGGAFLLAAILAGRVLLFDFQDPSAENALVTTLAALLAAVTLAKALVEGELVLPPTCVSAPLGFLFFLGFIATVFAVHRWPAELEFLAWATHGLVFVSAYSLCVSGRARHATDADCESQATGHGTRCGAMGAILAAALVVALFGIVQKAVILPTLGEEIVSTPEGRRLLAIPGAAGLVQAKEAFSTFLNPNVFSGYIAVVLPVACGVAISAAASRAWMTLAISCAVSLSLVAALYLTGSTGGFVATAAALATVAALTWGGHAKALVSSRRWRRLGLPAAAVASGLAAWLVAALVRSPSIRVRLEYWRATCAMIAEHPLGVGLANFSDFYTRYKTPAGWETREAHNVYLALAAEAGLAALAAFALLARGFARAVREPPTGKAVEPAPDAPLRALMLAGGLAGVLAAYVVGTATGLGTRASSIGELLAGGAGWRSAVVGAAHLAFLPAWCVAFWFCSRPLPERSSRAASAAPLGAIVGLVVHGLVEFDFRAKGIMLTVCALGAIALAERASGAPGAPSCPVRLRLSAGRKALAVALAATALVGLVWRGGLRTLGLWERSCLARAESERAARLERAARRCRSRASREERADDSALAESLDELAGDPALSLDAAQARSAIGSGDRDLSRLAARAHEEAGLSLARAWRLLREYLEIEPGDEREGLELAALFERAWARARSGSLGGVTPAELESATERVLARLAELSPASFGAHLAAGRFHASMGRLTQAASALEKAAAAYPLRPETWVLLGDARVFSDRTCAVEAYARAIDANRIVEDENTMLFARFWLYSPRRPPSRGGDLASALDAAEAELGRPPELAFRKGLLLAEIGGFKEAASEFARALEGRPGEAQLAAFKAIALEMEWARAPSEASRREADAAWELFRSLQGRVGTASRLNDFAAGLLDLRRGGLHAAARGKLP